LEKKFTIYRCIFDLPSKISELTNLEKQSENQNLWDDHERASTVMRRLSELKDEVSLWQKLEERIKDTSELIDLKEESLQADLDLELDALEAEVANLELSTLLSGPYDSGNAFLTINSGAGGTDAQDWAAMLERMYLRWAERRGYTTEILDTAEGEEAGIKSSTISVKGLNAYGYLHPEKGVHRLVRLSPFDAAHRRHTSFAQVEVMPEVKDDDTIVINPEDLRIDIFRSSGAGGQNVQKNATAVRLTHLPSGLVVTCQNERSQIQNRENAMRVLKSRLLEIRRNEQEKQLAELRGEFVKTEWGSQIRSYVLHPYQMVKDHRTEYEVGNTQIVLDGEIDGFIEAYLRLPTFPH
jgi:peptide chain release factor 2